MVLLTFLLTLSRVFSYVVIRDAPSNITDNRVRTRKSATAVSLVGGRGNWEGLLEISGSDGNYGSMCADSLTTTDRNVICKSLFYHRFNMFGYPANTTAFGGDKYSRVLNIEPNCQGSENDVTQCSGFAMVWSARSVCRSGQAALLCISDLDSIMERPNHMPPTEGRPEVYVNGNWGTICKQGFTQIEATMLCTFMRYWTAFGTVVSTQPYGNSHNPTAIQNLHCNGDEPAIDYCTWEKSTCGHDQDVALKCEQRSLNARDIRLTDGAQPWKGRVEVYLANRKKTVTFCSGGLWFYGGDATVVCRSMGFSHGGRLLKPMPVSQSAPYLMEQLYCMGNEQNIGRCAAKWARHSYDCETYPPTVGAVDCSEGLEVKLTGGKALYEGTVQLLVDGYWFTVDSASIHQDEARTLCSTLGYQDTNPHIFPGNHFQAPGHLPIVSLDCEDFTIHFGQCDVNTGVVHGAQHAAIRCFDCIQEVTEQETGVLTSDNYPTPVNNDVDCLYHITTQGNRTKYRFYFEDLTLGRTDRITVREHPMQPILSTFTNTQGPPEVIFTKDLYIRFKAHSGAKFQFKWEPATIGREQLENAISVQCTPTDMATAVDLNKLKAAFVDTDPSYLSLSDVTCRGVTSGNTWSARASHSSCKTQRLIQPGVIVYKNAVIYSVPGTSPGDVTVKWSVEIDCVFNRNTTMKANYSITEPSTNLLAVNVTSHYNATINLFSDSGLQNEVKGHPISVKLGSDLYADVKFNSNVGVRMRLETCRLKENMTQPGGYALIQNGCPTDPDTNITSQTATETVFHFKAVEFVAGVTSAYLTCDVTYCLHDDTSHACNRQCNTSHGRRETKYFSISVSTVYRLMNILS